MKNSPISPITQSCEIDEEDLRESNNIHLKQPHVLHPRLSDRTNSEVPTDEMIEERLRLKLEAELKEL